MMVGSLAPSSLSVVIVGWLSCWRLSSHPPCRLDPIVVGLAPSSSLLAWLLHHWWLLHWLLHHWRLGWAPSSLVDWLPSAAHWLGSLSSLAAMLPVVVGGLAPCRCWWLSSFIIGWRLGSLSLAAVCVLLAVKEQEQQKQQLETIKQ